MAEEPIGALLYGWGKEDAKLLEDYVRQTFGKDTILISGSNLEDQRLIEILQERPWGVFEEKETKVMMLLGFDDKMINLVLKTFPKGNLQRPIFCTPTEENIEWKISKLIGDLEEEERYWRSQREKEKGG